MSLIVATYHIISHDLRIMGKGLTRTYISRQFNEFCLRYLRTPEKCRYNQGQNSFKYTLPKKQVCVRGWGMDATNCSRAVGVERKTFFCLTLPLLPPPLPYWYTTNTTLDTITNGGPGRSLPYIVVLPVQSPHCLYVCNTAASPVELRLALIAYCLGGLHSYMYILVTYIGLHFRIGSGKLENSSTENCTCFVGAA